MDCQHTGERHAQIVCLKFAQETNVKNTEGGINRRPELLASLHNGQQYSLVYSIHSLKWSITQAIKLFTS